MSLKVCDSNIFNCMHTTTCFAENAVAIIVLQVAILLQESSHPDIKDNSNMGNVSE